MGTLHLPLLGEHNLSNALAAIAVGRQAGLEFSTIARSIATFGGTKRRFEHRGEAKGITFIDDYAHHPKEIEVTLAAAKLRVNGNNSHQRVVAIFQPHRYSRTKTFLQEFARAFKDADVVIITDIYSAGETNTFGIRGEDLTKAIAIHHQNVHYHADVNSLADSMLAEYLTARRFGYIPRCGQSQSDYSPNYCSLSAIKRAIIIASLAKMRWRRYHRSTLKINYESSIIN